MIKKFDWSVLNDYIKKGLIRSNKHPKHDIFVLNYTKKTQYNNHWDNITITCRGIVIDGQGNVIARSFNKFFNVEQHIVECLKHQSYGDISYNKKLDIYEKIDGSLGLLFYYNNEWILCSRGSFNNDIVDYGWRNFERYKTVKKHFKSLSPEFSYVFEIVSPENKIIVDYHDKGENILLAVIRTDNGCEIPYKTMKEMFYNIFIIVDKYGETLYPQNITDFNSIIKNLKDKNTPNREGFVVVIGNEQRVKIKFDNYYELHRLKDKLSVKNIFEYVSNNDCELFDEYFQTSNNQQFKENIDYVVNTMNEFKSKFNDIERISLKVFYNLTLMNGILDRKEFAKEALNYNFSDVLFKLYDRTCYDKSIWKLIKPK